ncbi:ATP-binding protein [candidate division KSB1 bacterium]|nr:ATP-binding protein [candidate division KSB1 bacterium]
MNLLKYNRHWEKFIYPFQKQRAVFNQLKKDINSKQIIEITGLRRTGKTTLMLQLINHLIALGVSPFRLWYFTFDEDKPHLDELIQTFSKQTFVDFKQEKIFLFLDEIQKLDNFSNQVKVYYDLYPNLKFVISGSTSLFIKKRTQESLAGRIKSVLLTPLSFEEYLNFTDKNEILDHPIIYQNEIEHLFENFIHNQFIESIEITDQLAKKDYFIGIMRKIIFEDITSAFSVANPEILWQVVRMIAQKPGMVIDYLNLANDIGLSNKTISNYLYYLEESFLVKKLYNFSRNLITSEKKLKRYYLSSPSFCWALADFVDTGRQVENLAASLKDYHFFWRDPYHHEIDFVDIVGDSIIPVEIKYKKKLDLKELYSIFLFCKKFKCTHAIIFTKNIEEKKIDYKDHHVQITEKPVFFL